MVFYTDRNMDICVIWVNLLIVRRQGFRRFGGEETR
jgi:hypothetical protein